MERYHESPRFAAAANFGVKLMRPGFGPAAELPASSPARWRHGGCSSPLGSPNVIGGNRRAASASARGTGRTAYTKDVRRTYDTLRVRHAFHEALTTCTMHQLFVFSGGGSWTTIRLP